jgi:hypothetical protein
MAEFECYSFFKVLGTIRCDDKESNYVLGEERALLYAYQSYKKNGRLLVRYSNTELMARMRVQLTPLFRPSKRICWSENRMERRGYGS